MQRWMRQGCPRSSWSRGTDGRTVCARKAASTWEPPLLDKCFHWPNGDNWQAVGLGTWASAPQQRRKWTGRWGWRRIQSSLVRKEGDRLDGREWMLGTAKQDLSRARGGRQGCGCGDQCKEGPHRPVAPVTQAPALPAPFCHSEAQLSPSHSPAPSSPFPPSTGFSKGKKRESQSSP